MGTQKNNLKNTKCCNGTTNQCKACRDKVQRDRMIYKKPDYGLLNKGDYAKTK